VRFHSGRVQRAGRARAPSRNKAPRTGLVARARGRYNERLSPSISRLRMANTGNLESTYHASLTPAIASPASPSRLPFASRSASAAGRAPSDSPRHRPAERYPPRQASARHASPAPTEPIAPSPRRPHPSHSPRLLKPSPHTVMPCPQQRTPTHADLPNLPQPAPRPARPSPAAPTPTTLPPQTPTLPASPDPLSRPARQPTADLTPSVLACLAPRLASPAPTMRSELTPIRSAPTARPLVPQPTPQPQACPVLP